jgi:cell wall-associated NlpC family hydrolase
MITANNEWSRVRGDWSGWQDAMRYLAQRGASRIIACTAANELDVFWAARADDVPPAFGARLVREAQEILRPLGIPVGTTTLGGPRWPEYLARMLAECDPDFVALNPYGWIFEGIAAKAAAVRAVAPERRIVFPELGAKIGDAGGEDAHAEALTQAAANCEALGIDAAWFAYHDAIGKPDERGSSAFGLVRTDGTTRPAFDAYAALHPPQEAPVPTIADYQRWTREAASRHELHEETFYRQIQQECGWSLDVILCRRGSSAGAQGIAQIVPAAHPQAEPCHPLAALDYAARWMKALVAQYGSYRLALAAYNAGPGNVARHGGVPPFAETHHYLDVILGPGWPEPTAGATAMKLSEVLARARSRIGDPYVWGGKKPPNTDCSGFVAWCYEGKVTAFTDAVLAETERVDGKDIAPGDIVLYEYQDAGQQGVRFPHMGLYLSDTVTLDNRFGHGVGEHPQLPRSQARRFYRRLAGVIVDTAGTQPVPVPAPTDPRDAEIASLKAQLDDARSRLGVASVDYVKGLRDLADALEALKP